MSPVALSILTDLRDALRNPQADPRQTVVFLAGAVALVLLLVFLALFLVTERPEPSPRRRRRRYARPAILVPVALVVVMASLVGNTIAGRPQTCRRCHELETSVKTWQQGEHSSTSCMSCHATPGLAGFGITRLRELSNLTAHLLSRPEDLSTAVVDGACLRCHADIRTGIRAVGTVRVRHSDFLDRGASCLDCHQDAGHRAANRLARVGSRMEQCLPCHDAVKARATCAVCHPNGIETGAQTAADYPKVDIPNRKVCEGCHSLEPCRTCHTIEMPHPDGFAQPRLHAPLAAFKGKDRICARCHGPAYCAKCHQPFDAHGAGWDSRHALAPRGDATCLNCHDRTGLRDLCALCHPNPGETVLPGQIPLPAGSSGS